MDELLHFVRDVSPFLKIGWAGWLLWAFVQVAWYRYGRGVLSPIVVPARLLPPRPTVRGAARPERRAVLPVDDAAPLMMTIEHS